MYVNSFALYWSVVVSLYAVLYWRRFDTGTRWVGELDVLLCFLLAARGAVSAAAWFWVHGHRRAVLGARQQAHTLVRSPSHSRLACGRAVCSVCRCLDQYTDQCAAAAIDAQRELLSARRVVSFKAPCTAGAMGGRAARAEATWTSVPR